MSVVDSGTVRAHLSWPRTSCFLFSMDWGKAFACYVYIYICEQSFCLFAYLLLSRWPLNSTGPNSCLCEQKFLFVCFSLSHQMAFKIRSSKFRHVYGSPFRKEQSYENLRITRNAHDSNFCAVNPKNLAVVTESAGGGAFVVLPVERVSICGFAFCTVHWPRWKWGYFLMA